MSLATIQQTETRVPSTQDEIIRRVSGAEPERLFWFRVDEAMDFLMGWTQSEEIAKKAWSTPGFWKWWIQLWAMSDRDLMKELDHRKIDTINWEFYTDFIRSEKKDRWIPGKVLPAIGVNI